MPKPAFIVDGLTEQNIVKEICSDCTVRRTDLNGKNVTIDAIALKVASLIRLFNNRNHPIVIIVDREERQESCVQMAVLLRHGLEQAGVRDTFIIGIPDRMIENWLIADWPNFIRAVNLSPDTRKPATIEGINGKGAIKRLTRDYHGPTHGCEIFSKANPRRIKKTSNSFDQFSDELQGKLSCPWLNR